MNSERIIKRVWQTKFFKDDQKYVWEKQGEREGCEENTEPSAPPQNHQREVTPVSLTHSFSAELNPPPPGLLHP